jgi:hypothetical protein
MRWVCAHSGEVFYDAIRVETHSRRRAPPLLHLRAGFLSQLCYPMSNRGCMSQEQNSALLSLPAQLRNIVWKLVLGGRTIHINARPKTLRVRTCSATEDDKQAIDEFIDVRHHKLPQHYQARHAQCWSRNNECCGLRASLIILLVCRQLYTESALLPFSTNDFAFDGSNSHGHDAFLERLKPLQRGAIRRVHSGQQIFYLESPFDSIRKLSGLQEIFLFLKDDICDLMSEDDLSGERKTWLIERLRDTQYKALRAIHVCISSNEGLGHLSKSKIIRWAQMLKYQIHCARAEPEPGSQRLVLRCRPTAVTTDTCLGDLDEDIEASD